MRLFHKIIVTLYSEIYSMKKYLVIIFVLCLVACSPTRKDIIENLIEEEMRQTLVNPDDYEVIDTKIDSAFSPIEEPELLDKINRLGRNINKLNTLDPESEEAKLYQKKIQQDGDDIVYLVSRPVDFIGLKAIQTYTTKNNDGVLITEQVVHIFDKELSKIVRSYYMEDWKKNIEGAETIRKQIKESIEKNKELIENIPENNTNK